ncbi:MAG: hypothetical protein RLZZ232_2491 [Planctomycetota bacterium]
MSSSSPSSSGSPTPSASPVLPAAEVSADKVPKSRVYLWHGLSVSGFVRLLSLKPQLSWKYADRLLTTAFMSGFNSTMNGLESLIYGRRVQQVQIEHPPIFILGHWRSGTTMLHNLITLNPQLTFLNLYQCLFPGHFLLTEKLLAPLTEPLLPKKRPMDNVEVSWKSAQEDEVALAVHSLLSPYIMPAFQGRMEVYERFLDPRDMTESERSRWKDCLTTLIRKMALIKPGSVVMKSPTHTYRVPTLLEMFPNAKFIYIYRDPRAVYQSTIHLRKMMFADNTLGPLRPDTWSEEAITLYEKSIRLYHESRHLIPAGNLCEVKFEDFEAAPRETLQQLHSTLGLPGWAEAEPLVTAEVSKFSGYRKNSYRMDAATREMLESRLKWVFDLYGYPINS